MRDVTDSASYRYRIDAKWRHVHSTKGKWRRLEVNKVVFLSETPLKQTNIHFMFIRIRTL